MGIFENYICDLGTRQNDLSKAYDVKLKF